MNSFRQRGFSRIDAISCMVIFSCIACLVIPGFVHRLQKRHALEILQTSQAIFEAEFIYFKQSNDLNSASPNSSSTRRNDTRMFLALPPTPSNIAAHPQQAAFNQRPWSTLNLKIDTQVRFQYQVTTNGLPGLRASFEVLAYGNRDKDDVLSQWRMRGAFDPNGKPLGKNILYRLDPTE